MDRLTTETWAATAMFVKWGLVFLKTTILVGGNRESRYCDNARVEWAPSAQSECVIIIDEPTKLSDAIGVDLVTRWAFPIWKDQHLVIGRWQTPISDLASAALTESNKAEPAGTSLEESFAREEIAIPVKCNVHPWMRSYIAVFKHPFFAVTGKDGSFDLRNLPPGDYTVQAWHEKLGTMTQKITVAPGEAKSIDFVFKAPGH